MCDLELKKFFIPYYPDAFSEHYFYRRESGQPVTSDKQLPNMVECENLLIDLNSVIQSAVESTISTRVVKNGYIIACNL